MGKRKACNVQGLSQGFPHMSTKKRNVTRWWHRRDTQDPEPHGCAYISQDENDKTGSSKPQKNKFVSHTHTHTKALFYHKLDFPRHN